MHGMCATLHTYTRARAFRGCALPLLLALVLQLVASGSGILVPSLPSVTNETETTPFQGFPGNTEGSGT